MQLWQAFVLGLIQGLTEFLPVSSSGHLTFLQRVFGVNIGGAELFFNIILHLGTLVAVCIIFWRDILDLFKKPFKTLLYLVVATIPAAVAGLLLDDVISDSLMGGKDVGVVLAVFFAFTAAVLLATEFYAKRKKRELPLCWSTTLPMGFAQAVAILPGISRSGSTIAAGTVSGAKSDDVANFSFLMSIPVILGSFLVSVFGIVKDAVGGDQAVLQSFGASSIVGIIVGVVASAVTGFLAIKLMLKVIKRANYKWFSLYLILLSLTILFLDIAKIL